MKKSLIFFVIAIVAALFVANGAMAVVVSLNDDSFCNDYKLGLDGSGLSGVYGAHGFEYGCGYTNRIFHGAVYVVGGYAYFGLNGVLPQTDYNQNATISAVVSMTSKTGTGEFQYIYFSGGTLTGHGNNSTYTMVIGSQADAESDGAPDSSLP